MKIKSETNRVALVLISWGLGWCVSFFGFHRIWGHWPESGYLIQDPLIYGIAALPASFAASTEFLTVFLDDSITSVVFIVQVIVFWPLNLYLIYRFLNSGSVTVYSGLVCMAIASGHKWHYYSVAMSGI